MKLGKLEFTADDFQVNGEWINPALAHEHANVVLAEKIKKMKAEIDATVTPRLKQMVENLKKNNV